MDSQGWRRNSDSQGPSRTDSSDHESYACSLPRGQKEGSHAAGCQSDTCTGTLTLGVQEGKKISVFSFQNIVKNLAAHLN